MGLSNVSLKANGRRREMQILEERREIFSANIVLKQAMMRTIVGNFGKGRKNRNANSRKEKGIFFCKHCSKTSHDEDHCWKLHPELKPESFKAKEKAKDKGKIVAITKQDLGSDSGDETKIIAMALKNLKGKRL